MVQVLGIPLETDVGITAPRYMRGSRHAISCLGGISFLGFAPTRRSHNASILLNNTDTPVHMQN